MKHLSILLVLFISAFTSCNNDTSGAKDVKLKTADDTSKAILIELIKSDVPKFIALLPSLPHNNMEAAFDTANNILGYNKYGYSVNEHTMEASSKIAYGKSITNGQLTLAATRLAPQKKSGPYVIYLFTFPRPDDDIVLRTAEPLLKNYKKIDLGDDMVTWEINGWFLQIGKGILNYSPETLKSLSESKKK